METRVQLLVIKSMLFNFSWDDLENYLSLKKNVLIEELNSFFKDKPHSSERVQEIISQINENERKRNKQIVVFNVER